LQQFRWFGRRLQQIERGSIALYLKEDPKEVIIEVNLLFRAGDEEGL
jgi:hypothetical protein